MSETCSAAWRVAQSQPTDCADGLLLLARKTQCVSRMITWLCCFSASLVFSLESSTQLMGTVYTSQFRPLSAFLTSLPWHPCKPSGRLKSREDCGYCPWQSNFPLWLWFELELFKAQGSHVNLLCSLANVLEWMHLMKFWWSICFLVFLEYSINCNLWGIIEENSEGSCVSD